MEAFGSSNALVTIEKMESGELPPSPFSGRNSWNIDFGGFGKIETEDEKQAKEYNSKESPIDVVIAAFFEGYNYISPQKSPLRRWLARLGGCAVILTLVVWISAIIGWKNEVHPLRVAQMADVTTVVPVRRDWTPEKPVGGIIATHHRSGTVLFQSLADRLCDVYTVDFERIAGPVNMKKMNTVKPIVYKSYYTSTKRLAVGMHGFKEACNKSEVPSAPCDLFNHECWMEKCRLDFSEEDGATPPVAHVVRNPKSLIISAYLYHRQDPPPEDWLREPKPEALGYFPAELQEKFAQTPFYEVLQEVSPEEGLLMEFVVNSEDIYRAARNHRDMNTKDWALNVKYEDILMDYDNIMLEIIRHIRAFSAHPEDNVVQLAKGFDLNAMSESDRSAFNVDLHITSSDERKETLWNILSGPSDLAILLSSIASSMGYAE